MPGPPPRPRPPRPPRRRLLAIGKWTGLALCVAIAGVWVASGKVAGSWSTGSTSGSPYFGVHFGTVSAGLGSGYFRPKQSHTPETWYRHRRLGTVIISHWPTWRWSWCWPWRPYWVFNSADWYLEIPLWAPFLLAAAPTAFLWWRSRRPVPGHCRCGYSLAGLGDGACPECGRAGENTRR